MTEQSQGHQPAPTKDMIDYWLSLGMFVHQFAQVETTLWLTLTKCAGVSFQTARAIFHGVRSDGARQYINRILEITNTSQPVKDDFQFIFTQLGYITDARNSILHYGTVFKSGDADEFFSTNAMLALTEGRQKAFPMSPIILKQMTEDLRKINAHLYSYLSEGAPGIPDQLLRMLLGDYLQRAWQYKPPPQASPNDRPPKTTPRR
jgi:hypothetical protein